MTAPDPLALARIVEAVQAEMRLRGQFSAEPQTKVSEKGFEDVVVNLANPLLAGTGNGFPLLARGYEISFLRRGSSPGALLQLIGGMGLTQPFGPGDYVSGRFDSGDIVLKLATGSAAAGTAVLRVGLQAQASFREAPIEVPTKPAALVGGITDAGVVTFATVVEDVVPSGAASGVTGAFTISGWRRVLVLMDTDNTGTNATSFQLCPFYQVTNGTVWFDQGGTELITVADSNPSQGRYRMVEVELSQAEGSCYLGIRNLLPGGQLTIGFCVLGVA